MGDNPLDWLQLLQDFGGLAVGAVLLVVASFLLPPKARCFVLTAGFAILFYEGIQQVRNRKRLEEADKEREVLRDKANELDAERAALAKRVAELSEQLVVIKERKVKLDNSAMDMEKRGKTISEKKRKLDKEKEILTKENNELLEESESSEGALAQIERARAAFRRMENADSESQSN